MRIFLLGFMGVGKSTIGKYLAEDLHIPFVDLDEWIEEEVQMPISELFKEYGEPFFRKLEFDHLRKVVETYDRFVMATGGGLPCFNDNISYMNEKGETVYLKASIDDLTRRLTASSGDRPIMKQADIKQYKEHITKLLGTREPIYSSAKWIVDLQLEEPASANIIRVGTIINEILTKH